jgi:hypothetical protein
MLGRGTPAADTVEGLRRRGLRIGAGSTYTQERGRLREEILLTEMDLADSHVELIDVESILTSAEGIITNAASLWREGTLQQRERLQWLLFPEGLKWDRGAFRAPTTLVLLPVSPGSER